MREIKFSVVLKNDLGLSVEYGYTLETISNIYQQSVFEVVAVREFTGLHDKNGKEIYEGDILEMLKDVYYKGGRCTVIYNDEKARFEVDKSLGFNHKSLSENIDRGFTVVGNLFENSSLLENKQ